MAIAGNVPQRPTPVTAFDLDAYLTRIAWNGPRDPTFATLAGVLRAHMTAIPFENLDVLLGRGIRIDLASVQAKLVAARRGGYCFEHGTLMQHALEALGFTPVAHTARVILMRPRAEAPHTHMLLTTRVGDETFVLDPGFGGLAPLVPVPLGSEAFARDGNEVHRLVHRDNEWVLEARLGGVDTPLWTSTLAPAEPIDFVMANHFVSTFPDSPFVTRLMMRAIAGDRRVSVANRDVTIRRAGHEERRALVDRAELRAILRDDFGFDLPDVDRLHVPSAEGWG